MRPDRSNYEIWFTDWLDGNLNEEQVEELKVFLNENPDLQEELSGLALISLEPSDAIFKGKKGLVKSAENLSEHQFEHLCIANLENDLTPLQKAELDEIVTNDVNKRRIFELIQKLKLKPSAYTFKRKKYVKKLTTGQKILRLSVIGLSAAASVALVIAAFLSVPRNPDNKFQQITGNLINDTLYIKSRAPFVIKEGVANANIRALRAESVKNIPETGVAPDNTSHAEQIEPEISGSTAEIDRLQSFDKLYVPTPENMFTAYKPSANVLRSFKPPYVSPLSEDDRSNVDRFLARFFHEKIMRDTISGDRPVESFEIVLAGVTGLNRLFGWQMALQKNIDEEGQTRSYYFSSKLLKINAPVRKTVNAL
jgi:hypothetical protein